MTSETVETFTRSRISHKTCLYVLRCSYTGTIGNKDKFFLLQINATDLRLSGNDDLLVGADVGEFRRYVRLHVVFGQPNNSGTNFSLEMFHGRVYSFLTYEVNFSFLRTRKLLVYPPYCARHLGLQ